MFIASAGSVWRLHSLSSRRLSERRSSLRVDVFTCLLLHFIIVIITGRVI